MDDFVSDVERVADSGFASLRHPIDVLVPDKESRVRSNLIASHVWQGTVPAQSFVRDANDFYVASPELCVLEIAELGDFIRVVCLMYEMCGTYSLDRSCESGFVARLPLTDPAKLQSFFDAAHAMRGVKVARRALRYIVGGSASPMETIVVVLLCFPCSLGGYGLPWPVLNRRIDVGRAAPMVEKSHYRCDLCWPEVKIAIEYDSDFYHTGPSRIVADSKRRNELLSLGYDIMTITRGQVFDYCAFDNFAHQFAKRAGFRIRERVSDCNARRMDLRARLFEAMRDPV